MSKRVLYIQIANLLMKIEVVKLLSPTNTNYLKDDCNDIIADVSLLAEVEAIIWVVWQQGRHVEHHLVTSLVNLLSSSFCGFLRYKQSDFTLPNFQTGDVLKQTLAPI